MAASDAKAATPSRNPVQDPMLRLECLQLAHRPGLAPSEVIAMAREYLTWICGAQGPTTPQGPGQATNTAPAQHRTSLPKSAA